MAGRAMDEARVWLSRLTARLGAGEAPGTQAGAVLLRGGDPALRFPLEGTGPWWIGRGAGAEVRLDEDRSVSRRHVLVRRHGASFTVEAAASATNAAWLGGAALPPSIPVLLMPGAVLVAGRTRLVFQPLD